LIRWDGMLVRLTYTEGAGDGCESCATADCLGGAEEGERHFLFIWLLVVLVGWLGGLFLRTG
jgi:hypothetical protein